MKQVYLFDPTTREFTEPYEAQESPLSPGEFIVTEFHCEDAPPKTAADEASVRNAENTVWIVVPDFRRSTVYDSAGKIVVIDVLGPLPNGLSLSLPSDVQLSRKKDSKLIEIETERDKACVQNVVAGGYTWQVDTRSQSLIRDAIARSYRGKGLPPVWRSADNVNVPLTDVAQLEAIEDAVALNVQQAYARSWQRKESVANAKTIQEVEAIVW